MATSKSRFKINMSIPVTTLREGAYFVLYTPAFDLSSYGKTIVEAQNHFDEAISIFFDEMLERGTLHDELTFLGWEIDKKNKIFNPPIVIENTLQKVSVPDVVYA